VREGLGSVSFLISSSFWAILSGLGCGFVPLFLLHSNPMVLMGTFCLGG
jgi:hypothetical protein